MGYGEYGGGGSVHWTIIHGGDGGTGNGRDPEPKRDSTGKFEEAQKFIVVINGVRTDHPINGDHNQIQIYWPPHEPGAIQDLQSKIDGLRRKNEDAAAAAIGNASGS